VPCGWLFTTTRPTPSKPWGCNHPYDALRALAYIALAGLIGVATGVILHRIVLGVLVAAGLLLLGLFILVSRSEPPGPEP
jgi:hypothetical protein